MAELNTVVDVREGKRKNKTGKKKENNWDIIFCITEFFQIILLEFF